jgi:O-antigen/teichoic acid export membrane protein
MRGLIGVAFSRGVASAGFILVSVVAARFMPLHENARFISSLSLVLGLAVVSRYGRDNALLRQASVLWEGGQALDFVSLVATAVRRTAFASVALGASAILLLVASRHLGPISAQGARIDPWLLAALPPLAVVQLYAAAFKAASRPSVGSMLEVGGVCFFASAFFVGLRGAIPSTSKGLSLVVGVQALLTIGVAHWSLARMARTRAGATAPRSVDLRQVQQLYRQASGPLFLTAFSYYLMQWGVNLIAAAKGDATSVAQFNAALRVTSIVPAALLVFNTVIAPRIAVHHSRGELGDLARVVLGSNLITSAFGLPLLLVILAFPGQIFHLLFSFTNDSGALVLRILVVGQAINLLAGPVMTALAMTGFERPLRDAYLVCSTGTVFCAMAMPGRWGIVGTAAVVAGGIAVLNLWLSLLMRRKLGLSVLLLIPRWVHLREAIHGRDPGFARRGA